ncbi:MAG: transposase, partial [Patescibacteria group bacterium]
MTIENLLPNISGLELESISKSNNSIKIKLGILLKGGECPCCHEGSIRIHSRYSRNVIDLPMAGNSVVIQFNTRKYFCDNVTCERKIFTERMGEELLPYARRTKRLNDQLVKIGFATGGNPGASLSKVLGISISTSTMLRILHQTPDAEMDTPRVLGVDDWAFRKGRTYGTILPDRESSTLKIWLKDHPGVEIITRDRAGPYSTGAKAGAPDAIQVADRWHLLKNLGEALKRMLNGHHKELRLTAKEIAKSKQDDQIAALIDTQEKKSNLPLELVESTCIKELVVLSKYHLNFLEIKRLKKEGHSIRGINRQTGVHRTTIKRYLEHEEYPEPAPPSTQPIEVRDYEDYIQKRWKDGQQNGKQLWREIKEQGFKGSYQSVYRLIAKYPRDPITNLLPKPLKIRAWSPRRVSIILTKEWDALEQEEQLYLTTLYKYYPKVEEAYALAKKFKE